MKIRKIVFSFIMFCLVNYAYATDNSFKIIAKVGSEVITERDYKNNKNLLAYEDSSKFKLESYDTILSDLIFDKVREIEAKKQDLIVEEKELDTAIEAIAKQKNMTIDLFKKTLAKHNIDYNFYLNKIKSEILWQKLIEKSVISKIFVSDYEVNELKEYLIDNPYMEKYDLSEISVYVNSDKTLEKAKIMMEKIYKEIQESNNFDKMAKNFSESLTSKNFGHLGWIDETDFNSTVIDKIKSVGIGEITKPFYIGDNENGVYLLFKVNDKKQEMVKLNTEETYKLKEYLYRKKLKLAVDNYKNQLYNSVFIEKY